MSNATQEMACLFTDREAPSDVTGSLATAAELLKAIDPGLLLLADGNGEVLAFHDMGAGVNLDMAGELALCMATRLLGPDHNECRFEFPAEPGVRLPLPFASHWIRKKPCSVVLWSCRIGANENSISCERRFGCVASWFGPPSVSNRWPMRFRCGQRACRRSRPLWRHRKSRPPTVMSCRTN